MTGAPAVTGLYRRWLKLAQTYRVLNEYWYFIAIYLSLNAAYMFCSFDVNFGNDPSGSFSWITNEGWINLINNSTALTNEEKAELIAKVTLYWKEYLIWYKCYIQSNVIISLCWKLIESSKYSPCTPTNNKKCINLYKIEVWFMWICC